MNVLLIGATGTVGSQVRQQLLEKTTSQITLYARHASRLTPDLQRELVQSSDITNTKALTESLQNIDIVIASLSGDLVKYAQILTTVMKQVGIQRLIFVSSMGIYNEIPASVGSSGNVRHNPMLYKYRDSADIVEQSGLDYTIIRPGWFDWGTNDYEVTTKNEPFGGHDVSVPAIADLIVKLAMNQYDGHYQSLGINRPFS